MQYTHDLIVIGAGSGGLGCAGFGSSIGLKVALIDKTAKNFGGDCLNYGCVPSKALLHVASLFAGGKQAEAFGLKTEGRADFKRVMAYVHGRQEVIRPKETPEHFREEFGTDAIVGTAKLTGKQEVTVNGKKLTAPKIVLATGSVPRHLDLPGIEQVKQWDNESVFWELEKLPEHLLIVGGGPISCELAQAFVRLGSKVTLLVRDGKLLAKDPPVMGEILAGKLREEGVTIRFNTEVAEFTDDKTAVLKGEGGAAGAKGGADAASVEFSHLLVAIGRDVRTEGLGLEQAGVKVEKGKIVTDDYYRTTNKYIFAIGDAFGQEQFSHGAEFHNTQLWNNLLSPLNKKHNLDKFTWVTFTDPEIASFGMTEERLKEKGIDFETVNLPLRDDDRAIAADYRDGHLIVYLSKGWGSGKVLGGCLAAPAAGEMIQELHFLQFKGMKYSALTNKIYAYPVGSRIIQKGARKGASDLLTSGPLPKILRGMYRLFNR
ncbi:dihydrolipoyl dehydrogenase family protein [Neolewinella persica]|uniref:dihydrolipoyl dehydrogenase family protein n=1 Tax=Neolewinella persica TaxID=70998 RepID=UPI000377D840|nr:FAD-dependent oxidoreductase [Neolewinella persica]